MERTSGKDGLPILRNRCLQLLILDSCEWFSNAKILDCDLGVEWYITFVYRPLYHNDEKILV